MALPACGALCFVRWPCLFLGQRIAARAGNAAPGNAALLLGQSSNELCTSCARWLTSFTRRKAHKFGPERIRSSPRRRRAASISYRRRAARRDCFRRRRRRLVRCKGFNYLLYFHLLHFVSVGITNKSSFALQALLQPSSYSAAWQPFVAATSTTQIKANYCIPSTNQRWHPKEPPPPLLDDYLIRASVRLIRSPR